MSQINKPRASELVEDPLFRQHYRFSRAEEVLRVEMWTEPGGGVFAEHYHPSQEERFEVLEGEITFTVEGTKRRAAAGETVVVAPGVKHAFQNSGSEPARLISEVQPALRLQENIEAGAAMARDGKLSKRGNPTGFGALVEAAEISQRFRDTTVLCSPPPAFQRVAFPILARLGRRRAKPS